ncbi:putative myeloid leukemia factor [Helianthus anomalus]
MHDTHPHPQAYSFTFQSSAVTYGVLMEHIILHLLLEGLTVTVQLRFEKHKEAVSTTSQAAHRISRGIHYKGHTLLRHLKSDGQVDILMELVCLVSMREK